MGMTTSRCDLGARLRSETRDAHLAAERAFDLPRRLRSLEDYTGGLLVMEAFLRRSAPALAAIAPRLPAQLGHGAERRRVRLHADLAALGCPLPESAVVLGPAHDPVLAPTRLADRALGAWYVHEGSALGGLAIAAEVRRRLPAATHATRYFAGEGRGTAARWRAFQAVLGEWERRGEAAVDAVLAGARDSFAVLTEVIG